MNCANQVLAQMGHVNLSLKSDRCDNRTSELEPITGAKMSKDEMDRTEDHLKSCRTFHNLIVFVSCLIVAFAMSPKSKFRAARAELVELKKIEDSPSQLLKGINATLLQAGHLSGFEIPSVSDSLFRTWDGELKTLRNSHPGLADVHGLFPLEVRFEVGRELQWYKNALETGVGVTRYVPECVSLSKFPGWTLPVDQARPFAIQLVGSAVNRSGVYTGTVTNDDSVRVDWYYLDPRADSTIASNLRHPTQKIKIHRIEMAASLALSVAATQKGLVSDSTGLPRLSSLSSWPELSQQPIQDAMVSLKRTVEEPDQQWSLFGVSVDADHLADTGCIAILSMLFLLGLHLSHVSNSPVANGAIPWIAVLVGPWCFMATIASMFLLPIVAMYIGGSSAGGDLVKGSVFAGMTAALCIHPWICVHRLRKRLGAQ